MKEFRIALQKFIISNNQIIKAVNEHRGRNSLTKKCEQINHNILKTIALDTQLPYISKHDQIDFEERKMWENFWLISPILGKKSVQEKKDDFLIAITKIENQRPTFGLISAPLKNMMFISTDNKAFKIENINFALTFGLDELLKVENRIKEPIEGVFFTIMKSKPTMNAQTEKYLDDFKLYKSGVIEEKIDPSPMRLIRLAEGSYDFHPHFKSINEWEIAPFDALITACGKRVTQKDGIMPLQYNSKKLKFESFIAKSNFDIDSTDLKE